MKKYKLFIVGLFAVIASWGKAADASSLSGKTIVFCGDGSGWPPYTYVAPSEPGIVQGYDVDVLSEILSHHKIEAKFVMPSWKQCLKGTENGDSFQVALSASYSDERASKFLLTKKYYTTKQSYFYSKKRFKNPPDIKQADDLFTYGQVCGRYAYNYEGSGVVKNSQIVQIGKSYKALISRTINDDCAFFLGRPSIILGFKLINKPLIDANLIGYAQIPKAKEDHFYMMISKNIPYANELKRLIDEGIQRLEKSGRLEEILHSYYEKMQR